ncbi:MAG: PepSY domain-containing protein [Acidobacteriota bacterium]
MSFLLQPQSHRLRKLLFQVHLWAGLALAAYVIVIGLTGSILVFRGDLQKATFPEFFTVVRHGEPDAPLATILDRLQQRYPGTKLSGLDYPTARRETYWRISRAATSSSLSSRIR